MRFRPVWPEESSFGWLILRAEATGGYRENPRRPLDAVFTEVRGSRGDDDGVLNLIHLVPVADLMGRGHSLAPTTACLDEPSEPVSRRRELFPSRGEQEVLVQGLKFRGLEALEKLLLLRPR